MLSSAIIWNQNSKRRSRFWISSGIISENSTSKKICRTFGIGLLAWERFSRKELVRFLSIFSYLANFRLEKNPENLRKYQGFRHFSESYKNQLPWRDLQTRPREIQAKSQKFTILILDFYRNSPPRYIKAAKTFHRTIRISKNVFPEWCQAKSFTAWWKIQLYFK